MSNVSVTDNPERRRFEARVDGELAASAFYRLEGDRVIFTHTETADAYAGHGVGTALARAALDSVRARGLKAVPLCPFVAAFIRQHDEYQDLVDR
jgi:predicted GNAT family acetyltransferase